MNAARARRYDYNFAGVSCRGPHPGPRGQIYFAPLCAPGRPRRWRFRHQRILARGRLRRDAGVPSGPGCDDSPDRSGFHRGRRPRAWRASPARGAARRRQLRHHDAPAVGNRRRPSLPHDYHRRPLPSAPADAADHRAADANGGSHRGRGRPAATHHRRWRTARYYIRTRDPERSGQERRAVGWAPRIRPDARRRVDPNTGPHGARARGLWRDSGSRRNGD